MTIATTQPAEAATDGGFYTKLMSSMLGDEARDHELIGFRLFPTANQDGTEEEIAEEAVTLHQGFLAGDYTDITAQPL